MNSLGVPIDHHNIKRGILCVAFGLGENTLVAVIVRSGKVIVPFGDDEIEAGDHVVIISTTSGISDLNEVIRK